MKSKLKNMPSTTDPYMEFLRSVKFKGIGLEESSIKLDRGALAEATEEKHQLNVSLNTNFDVVIHESEKFVVFCSLSLVQTKMNNETPLVTMNLAYSALFEYASSVDDALPKRFAAREARLVFWPYLRSFISDMCSRMAISTILLPLTAQFDNTALASSAK